MSIWGFDHDEILSDFVGPYLQLLNEHFGSDIQVKDMSEYYVHKLLGISRDEVLPVLNKAWLSEHLVNLPAYPVGVSLINDVKEAGHEVHIITSRGPDIEEPTRSWLFKHGVRFDSLNLTDHTNKHETAVKLGIDYFVEDNPRHANEVAEVGVRVFMPEYPWNRDVEIHSNVTRVKCVSEVRDHVEI